MNLEIDMIQEFVDDSRCAYATPQNIWELGGGRKQHAVWTCLAIDRQHCTTLYKKNEFLQDYLLWRLSKSFGGAVNFLNGSPRSNIVLWPVPVKENSGWQQ